MANYYTNFSLILPLPSAEAQAVALDLAQLASAVLLGDAEPETLPAALRAIAEDWTFQTEADASGGPGLWLYSENGGVEAVCAFIQHLLRTYQIHGAVSFEWSHDCSKPRVDAYGGGAAVVSADNIQSLTTAHCLRQHAA